MDKSILETIHESAKGLEKAGVMSKQTMREFDALCLPEVKNIHWDKSKLSGHKQKPARLHLPHSWTSVHPRFGSRNREKKHLTARR